MQECEIDKAGTNATKIQEITTLIQTDPLRMKALYIARELHLPQWLLAAGFVRNCIWDHLHGYHVPSPLSDIDLVYYNPGDGCKSIEQYYEGQLKQRSHLPWSVKNQARMHEKNNDRPYQSVIDAMKHWVEVETAMGVFLDENDRVQLVSAFPLPKRLEPTVTMNPLRPKPLDFEGRIHSKGWLELWPALSIRGS